eukprot:359430-Chlamydomonas_euryale.AAC.4
MSRPFWIPERAFDCPRHLHLSRNSNFESLSTSLSLRPAATPGHGGVPCRSLYARAAHAGTSDSPTVPHLDDGAAPSLEAVAVLPPLPRPPRLPRRAGANIVRPRAAADATAARHMRALPGRVLPPALASVCHHRVATQQRPPQGRCCCSRRWCSSHAAPASVAARIPRVLAVATRPRNQTAAAATVQQQQQQQQQSQQPAPRAQPLRPHLRPSETSMAPKRRRLSAAAAGDGGGGNSSTAAATWCGRSGVGFTQVRRRPPTRTAVPRRRTRSMGKGPEAAGLRRFCNALIAPATPRMHTVSAMAAFEWCGVVWR